MPVQFQPVSNSVGGEQAPQGVWLVTVTDIEEAEPQANSQFGNNGPQAKWHFRLDAPLTVTRNKPSEEVPQPKKIQEWIGYELHDYSALSMGPRSKARAWAEAILGVEPEEGASLDVNELIGCQVRANVGRSQGGRHKVVSLLPVDDEGDAGAPDDDADDEVAVAAPTARGRKAPF